MKKLIKPTVSMEDYSNELIQALCEYECCKGNCRTDTFWGCSSILKDDTKDDDILF